MAAHGDPQTGTSRTLGRAILSWWLLDSELPHVFLSGPINTKGKLKASNLVQTLEQCRSSSISVLLAQELLCFTIQRCLPIFLLFTLPDARVHVELQSQPLV